MRVRHFGDSYDIVKQSLLGWLKPAGAETEGTLMKIITLHPLVVLVEGRNSDTRGVCKSAVVKVIQKMESGDRDS